MVADDDKDNPFIRFKNHVNEKICHGVETVFGTPPASTPTTGDSSARRPTQGPAFPSLSSSSVAATTITPSPSPTAAAAAAVMDTAGAESSRVDSVMLWAISSVYSPLNLQLIRQPTPRATNNNERHGVTDGTFTFKHAFEDLLHAASGKPLPSLNEHAKSNFHAEIFQHVSDWLSRLGGSGLLPAYFPVGDEARDRRMWSQYSHLRGMRYHFTNTSLFRSSLRRGNDDLFTSLPAGRINPDPPIPRRETSQMKTDCASQVNADIAKDVGYALFSALTDLEKVPGALSEEEEVFATRFRLATAVIAAIALSANGISPSARQTNEDGTEASTEEEMYSVLLGAIKAARRGDHASPNPELNWKQPEQRPISTLPAGRAYTVPAPDGSKHVYTIVTDARKGWPQTVVKRQIYSPDGTFLEESIEACGPSSMNASFTSSRDSESGSNGQPGGAVNERDDELRPDHEKDTGKKGWFWNR